MAEQNNPELGVIVGRFQVPDLHEGHMELFRAVLSRHRRVVVFVGIAACKNATRRNPLDFETRRRMIQAKFPTLTVLPLEDTRTDIEWSKNLDREIAKVHSWGSIQLYGARDSFIPHYKGIYTPIELFLPVHEHDGSSIRAGLTNSILESYEFRAGIIHAVNNRRRGLYPAVDIAISNCDERGVIRVLLGVRKGLPNLWRFIGGYAEQTSSSYEEDAKREAYEETSLDLDSLKYISSRTIFDWRYNGEMDSQIRTCLFAGWSMTRGGKAGDDIDSVHWLEVGMLTTEMFVEEHRTLFLDLEKFLSEEKVHESMSANG